MVNSDHTESLLIPTCTDPAMSWVWSLLAVNSPTCDPGCHTMHDVCEEQQKGDCKEEPEKTLTEVPETHLRN